MEMCGMQRLYFSLISHIILNVIIGNGRLTIWRLDNVLHLGLHFSSLFAACFYGIDRHDNRSSPGGVPQPEIANLSECLVTCVTSGNCGLVDWDVTSDTPCWIHFNFSKPPARNFTGVTQYAVRLICV